MLKFVIIKPISKQDGQIFYKPVMESEAGEVRRELIDRVKKTLGDKKKIEIEDVCSAIENAFEQYKKEFKQRTVKLP